MPTRDCRRHSTQSEVFPVAPLSGYTIYSVTLSVDPYSASGYDAIVKLCDQLAHMFRVARRGLSAVDYDIV